MPPKTKSNQILKLKNLITYLTLMGNAKDDRQINLLKELKETVKILENAH